MPSQTGGVGAQVPQKRNPPSLDGRGASKERRWWHEGKIRDAKGREGYAMQKDRENTGSSFRVGKPGAQGNCAPVEKHRGILFILCSLG